ncbi:enoyl-CoA delta isomerase 1, mitochondrial-like isoform X2 [Amphiura filiformis]|uniref:enoyl-CoA delta isomerase 1, mitochondrial-like isoform X2 n=1 Tax=Amphiura filiformis TaxID=82378 RepID=UPI003B214DB2
MICMHECMRRNILILTATMLKGKYMCQLLGKIESTFKNFHPKAAGASNVCRQVIRSCSSQNAELLQVERDSVHKDVAWIKLNRPPVNSFSKQMLADIATSVNTIENDPTYRGIILSSSIPGIFSSGLDITEMYQKTPDYYADFWHNVQELWLRLYGSSLPVIAAINGHSPAGGCLMVLGCDYRIMATGKYIIGLNEVAVGVVPEILACTVLNLLNHRQTEKVLQLGTLFSVEDAVEAGLVDQSVSPENLEETARNEIAKWLKIPDHARSLSKQMMRSKAIETVLKDRQKDIDDFVNMVSQPAIQNTIGKYLQSLKARKK